MKLLLTVATMLSICCFAAAQNEGGAGEKRIVRGATPVNGGLELTTSIAREKYCTDGGMMLLLSLSYRNTGSSNLVLFKYAFESHEYSISLSAEDAAAKRFEQVITPMMNYGTGSLKFGDEPTPDYFIILKPGETYTPVNVIHLAMFIREKDDPDCRPVEGGDCESGLWPGHHVLQVKVDTWPDLHDPEPGLRARWKKFGEVWSAPLLSTPMSFEVAQPADRTLVNCNVPDAQQH
jgi:hypothetical protein